MDKMMFIPELIGVAAFAVSGAMAALEKHADIFGVLFLGLTTALGGGVIRDLLIGNTPPVMFTSYAYVAVSLIMSLLVFIFAYFFRAKYIENEARLDAVNNILDAVGLAVFTVSGINMAIYFGSISNPLLVIVLGVVTGVGGGVLRDTMLGVMAKLLRKRVYAVASLAGGILYYILLKFNVGDLAAAVAAMVCIFAIRVFATVFKWNLPSAEV